MPRGKKKTTKKGSLEKSIALEQKIQHLLEEIKIVLPGTQILLAFQLTSVFAPGFEELSGYLKDIYLVSIFLSILGIIMILTITTFHRIAEHGDDSHNFHTVASYLLMINLFCVSLALSLVLYVVTMVIAPNSDLALFASTATFALALAFWFIFPLIFRTKNR